MARYYSYGRRRYGRRYYRRGYRRYGGTSLRRYRAIQMNDDETKVMTFSGARDLTLLVNSGSGSEAIDPFALVNPYTYVSSSTGRLFFAGMMFDRMRFRSVSVTLRPRVMPASSATNYILFAAWDRYGSVSSSGPQVDRYSIQSDPTAKQVVWTPGGSGSPLRTWIYSVARDRYQYHVINHDSNLTQWSISQASSSPQFYPTLLLSIQATVADNTAIRLAVHARFTIEFQGGFSSTTFNFSGSKSDSLEQRVSALESKYNSNPADNNDDLVSVLDELSNPQ